MDQTYKHDVRHIGDRAESKPTTEKVFLGD